MLQALSSAAGAPALLNATAPPEAPANKAAARHVEYPRRFSGEQLKLIAFPLGGIGAGAVSLGGRGQLRDWEIFNKPDKGHAPNHGYACIWVKTAGKEPFASILESRILPPYDGASGLGSGNAPGMVRLESATFTGEYPLATIDFHDSRMPVDVQLRAFSPFIPLDLDESGLPVAILRYRVRNPGRESAEVSIGFALENMLGSGAQAAKKNNEIREDAQARGLIYRNPGLEAIDPMQGSDGRGGGGWRRSLQRAARLAERALVGEPAAVLGRFLGRWRAGAGGAGPQQQRRRGAQADARGGRREDVHVRAGVALPESHAGPLRLERAEGPRERAHRQLVRDEVR